MNFHISNLWKKRQFALFCESGLNTTCEKSETKQKPKSHSNYLPAAKEREVTRPFSSTARTNAPDVISHKRTCLSKWPLITIALYNGFETKSNTVEAGNNVLRPRKRNKLKKHNSNRFVENILIFLSLFNLLPQPPSTLLSTTKNYCFNNEIIYVEVSTQDIINKNNDKQWGKP